MFLKTGKGICIQPVFCEKTGAQEDLFSFLRQRWECILYAFWWDAAPTTYLPVPVGRAFLPGFVPGGENPGRYLQRQLLNRQKNREAPDCGRFPCLFLFRSLPGRDRCRYTRSGKRCLKSCIKPGGWKMVR